MIVYQAVTADRYELPIYQADSVSELSKLVDVPVRTIFQLISKHATGKILGIKFVRIDIGDMSELYTDNPNYTFAKRLKLARMRLNLTQREMGDKLDINYKTVAHWERGEFVPEHPEAVLNKLWLN